MGEMEFEYTPHLEDLGLSGNSRIFLKGGVSKK